MDWRSAVVRTVSRNLLLGSAVCVAVLIVSAAIYGATQDATIAILAALGMGFGTTLAFSRKWYREVIRKIDTQTEHLRAASMLATSIGRVPIYWSPQGFAPETLHLILHLVRSLRARRVLELGSGVSTAFVARCLQTLGGGMVESYDHDARWAEISRESIAIEGLDDVASVSLVPMTPVLVGREQYSWYSLPSLTGIKADFIIVDGPPSSSDNPLARLPALYQLRQRMEDHSVLVLDDANREWETEVGRRWQTDFPELRFQKLSVGRGLLVVSKSTEVFDLLPQ